MLGFWLMLLTIKLYSRKDIFKKQLLFIVFNPLIHNIQILAVAARILKCVSPFWEIMH